MYKRNRSRKERPQRKGAAGRTWQCRVWMNEEIDTSDQQKAELSDNWGIWEKRQLVTIS